MYPASEPRSETAHQIVSSPAPKHPPRNGRVMPIPGRLKLHYEQYVAVANINSCGTRASRGKDYRTWSVSPVGGCGDLT
jgi:hypothetical protein